VKEYINILFKFLMKVESFKEVYFMFSNFPGILDLDIINVKLFYDYIIEVSKLYLHNYMWNPLLHRDLVKLGLLFSLSQFFISIRILSGRGTRLLLYRDWTKADFANAVRHGTEFPLSARRLYYYYASIHQNINLNLVHSNI